MRACRACKNQFNPTPHQIRKRDIRCPACRSVYEKARLAKRAALGIIEKKMPKEWFKKYLREYNQRPYVKARRNKWVKEYRRNPVVWAKYLVRQIAKRAVMSGKIEKLPCAQCGAPNSEKHHPDYSQPLVIVWLCRPCHQSLHMKIKSEGTT